MAILCLLSLSAACIAHVTVAIHPHLDESATNSEAVTSERPAPSSSAAAVRRENREGWEVAFVDYDGSPYTPGGGNGGGNQGAPFAIERRQRRHQSHKELHKIHKEEAEAAACLGLDQADCFEPCHWNGESCWAKCNFYTEPGDCPASHCHWTGFTCKHLQLHRQINEETKEQEQDDEEAEEQEQADFVHYPCDTFKEASACTGSCEWIGDTCQAQCFVFSPHTCPDRCEVSGLGFCQRKLQLQKQNELKDGQEKSQDSADEEKNFGNMYPCSSFTSAAICKDVCGWNDQVQKCETRCDLIAQSECPQRCQKNGGTCQQSLQVTKQQDTDPPPSQDTQNSGATGSSVVHSSFVAVTMLALSVLGSS